MGESHCPLPTAHCPLPTAPEHFPAPTLSLRSPYKMDPNEFNGLKRKDTTKGPPLRVLSLGMWYLILSILLSLLVDHG